ncbi:conserved Plasmodium protein, unknown function [Plasmodium relictum]|uniref:Uncharacterized protein n=1 Tax=Plasmodium relictum TaxID=85471 RepID=A0A1J1H7V8_PLARL|nr:conserved Plasmodium protein, unknown function [Plasmodium relictum]CRH01040.1 conserved Plasmodium protein, unknown function [Plasmodium relictum]
MFKFLYDIELAKNKIFNQLNIELINQNKKNGSFFLEEKRNMNCDLVSDTDIIYEKNELRNNENKKKVENEKYNNICDLKKSYNSELTSLNPIKNNENILIKCNETMCNSILNEHNINIKENYKSIKEEKEGSISSNIKNNNTTNKNNKNEMMKNILKKEKANDNMFFSSENAKEENNDQLILFCSQQEYEKGDEKEDETKIIAQENKIFENLKKQKENIDIKDNEKVKIEEINENIKKGLNCNKKENSFNKEDEDYIDDNNGNNENENNKNNLISNNEKKNCISSNNMKKNKISDINRNNNNGSLETRGMKENKNYSVFPENYEINNKNNQVDIMLNIKNEDLIEQTNNDYENLTNKSITTKKKKEIEKNKISNNYEKAVTLNKKLNKVKINKDENKNSLSKNEDIISNDDNKNCDILYYNCDLKNDEKQQLRKKDISIETDFFLKKNDLNRFEDEIIKNINHNLVNEEYSTIIENIISLKKQHDNRNDNNIDSFKLCIQKLFKLFIGDINDLFNNIIYCNNDLDNMKYINDLKKKYVNEITDLKKKEKMLSDINERQTNQLLQLSGQISHIKNDSENYDNNYLNEKFENLEIEIKKLKDEKQKLHNLLQDKMIYMKKNFELKCYIKSLESSINKKSLLCVSLKNEKKVLTEKLKKYYEYFQLTKEDLNIYKRTFYDIKKDEKKIKEKYTSFLRNYMNKRIFKYSKEKKKIKKFFKQKKVKLKYIRLLNKKNEKLTLNNDEAFSKNSNKKVSDNDNSKNLYNNDNNKKIINSNNKILLKDDKMLIRNDKKLSIENNLLFNNYGLSIKNDYLSSLDKRNEMNKNLIINKENDIKVKKKNLTDYENNEELINKINYYKLLLEEYKYFSLKSKNSTNTQLKEMKKLLSQEKKENEMIQKKYECLLDKFQDAKKDNTINSEINESHQNLKIKELLNEINELTKEIERLREDQLLLQEDVNNKSKIISHLIKKHALNEEHFRLDKSFSIFNNKLNYEEMKKIMEETLIENIRLRTDLMILAKSVKEKKS